MRAGTMRLKRLLKADSLCLQQVHAPHRPQPETDLVLQDGEGEQVLCQARPRQAQQGE